MVGPVVSARLTSRPHGLSILGGLRPRLSSRLSCGSPQAEHEAKLRQARDAERRARDQAFRRRLLWTVLASSLALPSLSRAAPPGRPSQPQTLAGRIRLRPGSTRRAVL